MASSNILVQVPVIYPYMLPPQRTKQPRDPRRTKGHHATRPIRTQAQYAMPPILTQAQYATPPITARKVPRRPQRTSPNITFVPRARPASAPAIYFYNRGEDYYAFTNFSEHSVEYNGDVFPTSEHLFQSFKFTHKPWIVEEIRLCAYPRDAYNMAKNRFKPDERSDWLSVNIMVMDYVLYLKFTQHRALGQLLLDTGNAQLFEESPYDRFWGTGTDGSGQNELGKALQRLRERLCLRQGPPPAPPPAQAPPQHYAPRRHVPHQQPQSQRHAWPHVPRQRRQRQHYAHHAPYRWHQPLHQTRAPLSKRSWWSKLWTSLRDDI